MLRLSDGVYLDICATIMFYRNTIPSDSLTAFSLQHPHYSLHMLYWQPKKSFPLQNEARKKHFVDHSDRLAVSLNISSWYFLCVQTLTHKCLFPQQWVVSIYLCIALFLYFKVECLSRAECWSPGQSWRVGHNPTLCLGPSRGTNGACSCLAMFFG